MIQTKKKFRDKIEELKSKDYKFVVSESDFDAKDLAKVTAKFNDYIQSKNDIVIIPDDIGVGGLAFIAKTKEELSYIRNFLSDIYDLRGETNKIGEV